MGVEGYVLYLAMIFAPGVGFGELLGLWKSANGGLLSERFAMAFGLGLGIDTVVLALRTSGLSVGSLSLNGVDYGTLYAIIVAGILALLVSLLYRRKISFPVRPGRVDYAILGIMAVQGVMLFLYFQKYPFFPAFTSDDFHSHVFLAEDLLSGTVQYGAASGEYYYPVGGILYGGVHFQLASSFLLVNGEDLIVAQITMAILAVLSTPLLYLASLKITNSKIAAVISSFIYAISATVWFTTIFDSGLYANFFGILASLFLIVAIALTIVSPKKFSSWAVLVIATVNLYMSHYSDLTVLPAIVLLPFIQIAIDKRGRLKEVGRYFVSAAVVVVPAIIGAVLLPVFIQLIISDREATASLSGSTALSGLISKVPFLQYLGIQINNDLAFIIIFVLSAIYVYRALEVLRPLLFVPIIWFFALWLFSAGGQFAWRFSVEALVPLTIMSGYAVASFFPQSEQKTKVRRPISNVIKISILLVICIAPIMINSWGQTVVADSLTNTSLSAQSQSNVYDAIYWLGQNTPNDSGYLSLSDWRFTYSDVLIGRVIDYANVTTSPQAAVNIANEDQDQYVIVTRVVTYQVPLIVSEYPWNYFPGSYAQNVTLIYSNPDVKIYNLTSLFE